MDPILKQLQTSYQFLLDTMFDLFKNQQLEGFGFKINEFSVFASFLVTSYFLGENKEKSPPPALAEFHKAIVVAIVDRIMAESPKELDQEEIDKLTGSIQEIMTGRYGEYSSTLRAEADRGEGIGLDLLVASFLSHGLAQPLDEHDSIRHKLSSCLQRFLTSGKAT